LGRRQINQNCIHEEFKGKLNSGILAATQLKIICPVSKKLRIKT
jgi:hypothetical protein